MRALVLSFGIVWALGHLTSFTWGKPDQRNQAHVCIAYVNGTLSNGSSSEWAKTTEKQKNSCLRYPELESDINICGWFFSYCVCPWQHIPKTFASQFKSNVFPKALVQFYF